MDQKEKMHAGHALDILASIQDADSHRAWENTLSKPYPNLLRGYEHPLYVGEGLRQFNPVWLDELTEENCNNAVSGRIYTHLSEAMSTSKASDEKDKEVVGIQNFLHTLGVGAVARSRTVPFEGIIIEQNYIFLPDMEPASEPGGLPARNIDGAVLFLGYLLHKGYVTEQEAHDAGQEGGFVNLLPKAKSIEVQNKIRGALGEELLPAEERGIL